MALTQLPGTMIATSTTLTTPTITTPTINTVTSATGQPLVLQTNNGTTAVTINTSQQVSFVNNVSMPNTFGFKNRIINGAMAIDQRNSGSSYTPTSSSPYTVDRWAGYSNQAGKFTTQQVADAPAGFTYSTKITSSSAYSVQSNDYFSFSQQIEGYNVQDIAWGTVNSQYSTLSFWVKSSLTGSFGGSIQDSAEQVCFAFTYTIASANTWQHQTVTILPYAVVNGTWGRTNGSGCFVWFGLGAGSGRTQSVTNQWTSAQNLQPTGTTQVVATNGATIQFTGVQLEVGTQATSFDYRDYGRELMMAQRYYWQDANVNYRLALLDGGNADYPSLYITYPVPMRTASPSCTFLTVSAFYYNYSGQRYFTPSGGTAGFSGTPTTLYAIPRLGGISNYPGSTYAQCTGQWNVQIAISTEF